MSQKRSLAIDLYIVNVSGNKCEKNIDIKLFIWDLERKCVEFGGSVQSCNYMPIIRFIIINDI